MSKESFDAAIEFSKRDFRGPDTLIQYRIALAQLLHDFAARSRWRLIETAPKDGTRIVISDGDVPAVGLWSAITECWVVDWDHEKYDDPAPTAWCPLPEPPSCP